jgi:hypothetical protein
MPQVFKIGSYWVYFWTNENEPLEPIPVHVSQGSPRAMLQKFGLQGQESVIYAIIIRIYLSGF